MSVALLGAVVALQLVGVEEGSGSILPVSESKVYGSHSSSKASAPVLAAEVELMFGCHLCRMEWAGSLYGGQMQIKAVFGDGCNEMFVDDWDCVDCDELNSEEAEECHHNGWISLGWFDYFDSPALAGCIWQEIERCGVSEEALLAGELIASGSMSKIVELIQNSESLFYNSDRNAIQGRDCSGQIVLSLPVDDDLATPLEHMPSLGESRLPPLENK